ncbi:hypothetical protein [uncultured Thiodictyon sp.]|uniref:hypothetical protein n=1 Tax=uncultured Thiodictyon sp. TaxID=1846217 RepID=UPI0025E9C91D|nr:hypothetical protein [uncultured Thiodictyon sp.]
MATVFTANRSSVLVDGEPLEGLQSLTFRVVTEREDVRAVGSVERIDVSFGLRTVQGELAVKSANFVLDGHLQEQTRFQLVANLKKDAGADSPKRTLSFDDCFVETKSFGMDASGSAVTTYAFSATRVREE